MPFDLDDCLELLLDLREEEFQYERFILLFQFQTWIWYPGKNAARDAGRLAAAAVLRKLEKEHEWVGLQRWGGSRQITLEKLHSLASSNEYQQIFDRFIAPQGGWSQLLFTTPWDREFDKRIKDRSEARDAHVVGEIVHYRLRAILDRVQKSKRSGTKHAIFFVWRQTGEKWRDRSAWSWWSKFHRSAVFIYLINRRSFPMKPPRSSDEDFTRKLLHPQMSKARLKQFFSEYQFVADTLGDDDLFTLPAGVKSGSFNVDAFSTEEQAIIQAYDTDSHQME